MSSQTSSAEGDISDEYSQFLIKPIKSDTSLQLYCRHKHAGSHSHTQQDVVYLNM